MLLLAFSSCKKEEEVTAEDQTPTANQPTQELLQQLIQPSLHQINAQFPDKIRTSNYGEFIFAPNSFVNSTGEIASGTIQIEILEIYKNSDFFFSGQSPISDGNYLVTGGQFNIKAYQDGELLQPSSNYLLEARVPTNQLDENMQLYTGIENPDGMVNWLPNNGNGNLMIMSTDSIINDCYAFCGQLVLNTDQTLTLSYTNNGNEDESSHSGYLYTGDGTSLNVATGSDFNFEYTPTNDGVWCSICLYDQEYNGWDGSFVTIDVDGVADNVSVNSENCEPVPFSYLYNIQTTHYGWINCDYFSNQNSDSELTVFVDGDHNCMSTVMYTFFTNEQSMGSMYCAEEDLSFHSFIMPSGTPVTVAALSYIEGQYYSAFESITVTGNTELNVSFEETTLAEFELAIDQL